MEGAFKGLSSHELDVAFLLQNFNGGFPERSREVARAMADQFIKFVNGESWVDEGKVVVFTDEGVDVVIEEEYDVLLRGGRGKVLEGIGNESLWRLAEAWQGVRAEEEEGWKAKL